MPAPATAQRGVHAPATLDDDAKLTASTGVGPAPSLEDGDAAAVSARRGFQRVLAMWAGDCLVLRKSGGGATRWSGQDSTDAESDAEDRALHRRAA